MGRLTEEQVDELLEEVVLLRSGKPFHVHQCHPRGSAELHTWNCQSPYCLAIAQACEEHGGGATPPPTR